MLLADDGHQVVVIERDPAAPPDPKSAWDDWDRSSVRQFHMGHFFLPRFQMELTRNLPRVREAMAEAGALAMNPMNDIPDEITGGRQPDDDRFEALTGRRPVIEAVVANCAQTTPGILIRRGVVVTALVTEPGVEGAPPHVVGVETDDGQTVMADLVVDASGRNSSLPRLLTAAGATAPVDESEDSGFVYYGRAYESTDGSLPAAIGGGLQAYDSISTLTLAADNGTWQVAFVASGRDAPMRKVRDEMTFNRLWRSYPLVAHWLDGEPLSEIEMMANLEDRIRHFVVDGQPVATGLAAVGDSWACTNPSVGRGASLGLLHAVNLRDHLRDHPLDDPVEWSLSWDRRTSEHVEPFYRETLRADRHRLRQIEAEIEGDTYESDDPAVQFLEALPVAMLREPAALRAFLDYFMLHRLMDDIMTDTAFVTRVIEMGQNPEPAPGPSRSELLALIGPS